MRYLVLFTTPVEGGWNTAYVEAWAIVVDTEGNMPYGWCPVEINGKYVHEVKYIIACGDACPPQVISGEYDRDVPITHDGEIVLMDDATMIDDEDDPIDTPDRAAPEEE